MPRFYCPTPLATGDVLELPAGAARHVQVLRLQPGNSITLFNGGGPVLQGPAVGTAGGEFEATVVRMGRNDVTVKIGVHNPVEREAARAVHLAVGMPANERMDWLVEKATELGVASIQPLMTERSVLRLSAERADKKIAHWQSIAIAACEQCGRNQVPLVHRVVGLAQWTKAWADSPGIGSNASGGIGNNDIISSKIGISISSSISSQGVTRSRTAYLLSLRGNSLPLRRVMLRPVVATSASPGADEGLTGDVTFLCGPEGGLSEGEEQAALDAGFVAVSLGARVLRAETAALAALTLMA